MPPLNDITFTLGQGGLGRPPAGEFHHSGMLFFRASYPTGFSANDQKKTFRKIADAEAAGITEGDANFGVLWYHINRFFQKAPGATLHVMIVPVPAATGDYNFEELAQLQAFAGGKIRRCGVYVDGHVFDTTHPTAIQVVCDALFAEKTPISEVILTPDVSGEADMTALADLRDTLDCRNVGIDIGQDGAAEGAALFATLNKSIGSFGNYLGLRALSEAHESIAWPAKFKASDVEFDVPAFGNGDLIRDMDKADLDAINDKGYIFLRKIAGLIGSYYNDSHAAIIETSDYAYLENSAVIDEAVRQVYANVIPDLARPLNVDPDTGKLDVDTIMHFESLAEKPLLEMQKRGNFSGATDGSKNGFQAIIDPEQDVLSTSELEIELVLVPRPIGRQIKIKIGYALKLS